MILRKLSQKQSGNGNQGTALRGAVFEIEKMWRKRNKLQRRRAILLLGEKRRAAHPAPAKTDAA